MNSTITAINPNDQPMGYSDVGQVILLLVVCLFAYLLILTLCGGKKVGKKINDSFSGKGEQPYLLIGDETGDTITRGKCLNDPMYALA
jgi:hypothetical protein